MKAALADNPNATVYVKTHPQTTAGHKRGYLTHQRGEVMDVMPWLLLQQQTAVQWHSPILNQRLVFMGIQVEDDASIRLGCTFVKTNLGLLQAVRFAHPQAFIVYKPHPDVVTGNRAGHLDLQQALQWADHVETHASLVSCIHACEELHTLTSLSGFDALLRGKPVTTYGLPF